MSPFSNAFDRNRRIGPPVPRIAVALTIAFAVLLVPLVLSTGVPSVANAAPVVPADAAPAEPMAPAQSGLDVSVAAANPNPVAGGLQTYFVTITNYGPSDVPGAVADFSWSGADATLVTINPSGCVGTTCDLGTLSPGEVVAYNVVVRVAADATCGADLAFTASVEGEDQEDDPVSASVTTPVRCVSDLRITKYGKPDGQVAAGDELEYTIVVDNLGPSYAPSVAVKEILSAEGEFEITDIYSDRASTCTPAEGIYDQRAILDCTLTSPLETLLATNAQVNPGRWILRITVESEIAQDINNSATVVSPAHDPDESNNQALVEHEVTASADLELTKRDDLDIVTAGNLLRYTIRVTNTGQTDATNVRIYDNLPAETELVAVTVSDGDCNAGTPGDPTDPTRCVIDEMDWGESHTMTVFVRVSPDVPINPALPCDQPAPYCRGRIFNDAWVVADEYDPEMGNNLETEETDVKFEADLQVFKHDTPDVVTAGELLTYEVIVNNAGPSTSRDVVLIDYLPDEVEFIRASLIDGGADLGCVLTPVNQLVCQLGDIPPGAPPLAQLNVFITVRVLPETPAGTITNSALARSFNVTYDPVPANNDPSAGCTECVEETRVTTAADLSIEKTSEPVKVFAGEQKKYTITVTNNGPSDALDVVVTDTLPPGVIYEIDTDSCAVTGTDPATGGQ
ncbi:MAG: hypothetical protein ACK2T6_00710, partial [Anaerolineae bacterium]